jgi:uncharacterized protein (TIGR03067 family)
MNKRNVWKGFAALVATILLTGAEKKKEERSLGTGAEELQGTWKLVKVEKDGKDQGVKPTDPDFFKLQISGDKMTVQFTGSAEEGTYKAGRDEQIKTIDILPLTNDDKGKTILGIYERTGDKLRLCVAEAGAKTRPKTFKSRKDEVVVYHLEKEKK